MNAPIILFVYNRPTHTNRTIEALKKNDMASDSLLYIFSDGPKIGADDKQIENIQKVREIIHSVYGFKKIIITERKKKYWFRCFNKNRCKRNHKRASQMYRS